MNQVPQWINEELPETLDGLNQYLNYCEVEIKRCKSVSQRLDALLTECKQRIKVRKQEVDDERSGEG